MAFFPLFPLLERIVSPLTHNNPFYAGLLVSNLAGLGMFMVLYRLVKTDFGQERAWRTVLFLAVYPFAFYFAAAYTEALFMFFIVLTYYLWRRGNWWLAGLSAIFSGLTRSTSVCLLVPFIYEYLAQRDFQWRKIRFDIISGIGILGGVIIFGIYGYITFHDFLAFSHAQSDPAWGRAFSFPWVGAQRGIQMVAQYPFLSYISISNVIGLSGLLFFLVVLVLAFVGPVRFHKKDLGFALFGVAIFLMVNLVAQPMPFPNSVIGRLLMEIFPVFIVLAGFGKSRNFNLYYLTLSFALLVFFTLQWVTGSFLI